MKNNAYLLHIIDVLSTRTNVTKGVSSRKNIKIKDDDLYIYGRDNIMSLLKDLEKNPNLDVKVKWEYTGVKITGVSKFSIPMNKLELLCNLANVKSKIGELEEARIICETYDSETTGTWLNQYYKDMILSLERGTISSYIKDVDYHKGLIALSKNMDVLYYRTFSQNIFHNSKLFENKYKTLFANKVKKYHPSANEEMKVQELLELCNLYSYNQNFEYMGDMNILLDKATIIGEDVYTGIKLNTKALREEKGVLIPSNIKKIVTIENKDNYYTMNYSDDTLYIFVHGFLSPIEQKLCKNINDIVEERNIEVYHWGDMDFGGIRIYKHIKTFFPSVKPMKMSQEDYLELLNQVPGYDITEETKKKLEIMDAEGLEGLKEVILKYGKCFEQEEQL